MSVRFNKKQRRLFKKAAAMTVAIRTKWGGGTGVVILPSGVILTAAHVIEDEKTAKVMRCTLDRRDMRIRYRGPYAAEVLAIDTKADVAALKLKYPPGDLCWPVLDFSNDLSVGAGLFRIGMDDARLAAGHLYDIGSYKGVLELSVSMPAGPGASGGPLFADSLDLVGIVLRSSEKKGIDPGTAYAIPLHTALRCLWATVAFRDEMLRCGLMV